MPARRKGSKADLFTAGTFLQGEPFDPFQSGKGVKSLERQAAPPGEGELMVGIALPVQRHPQLFRWPHAGAPALQI